MDRGFGQNDTLARVTLWPVFLPPLGEQKVKKKSKEKTKGRNLKNVIITFHPLLPQDASVTSKFSETPKYIPLHPKQLVSSIVLN